MQLVRCSDWGRPTQETREKRKEEMSQGDEREESAKGTVHFPGDEEAIRVLPWTYMKNEKEKGPRARDHHRYYLGDIGLATDRESRLGAKYSPDTKNVRVHALRQAKAWTAFRLAACTGAWQCNARCLAAQPWRSPV